MVMPHQCSPPPVIIYKVLHIEMCPETDFKLIQVSSKAGHAPQCDCGHVRRIADKRSIGLHKMVAKTRRPSTPWPAPR